MPTENSEEPRLPIYRAPALPLGRDFHGLVYLHGCVDDRADRLVLTDADFGRAYLSEGWARTFLQSLYAEFNVLFVGFSHDDVLLTYLAKGLSPHGPTKRHAFQLRGEEKKWDRIHVTPIPYGQPPSPADVPADHSDLGQGVLRWLELLRLKPSDEMARVRSIVSRTESPAVSIGGESTLAPSGDASSISGFRPSLDDADFLRRTLGDSQKIVWFIESAKDLRWVAWALEAKLLGSWADPQVRAINPVPKQRVWWTTEVARVMRGKNETQQRQVWDSWAKDYLLRFRQGAFGDPTREDAKEEFGAFLHWPIAFSAIGDAVLDGLQAIKAWRIEQLDVIYEIKQIGLATKAPDLVARYLRWTLVDVGADRWGFYGLDDVLTDIVVTGRSRSDLEQVSERLLVMQIKTGREILVAKLAAFDSGQGPQNPPPASDAPSP